MGHASHRFFYEVESFAEAVAAFRRQKEADRQEHGWGESLDSVAGADDPKRSHQTFTSKAAATHWLEENVDSYECIAVQVNSIRFAKDMTEEEKTKINDKVLKQAAKEIRAEEKAKTAYQKAVTEFSVAAAAADDDGIARLESRHQGGAEEKVEFVTCRGCKSRINIKFRIVKRDAPAGNERVTYLVRSCPVCDERYPYSKNSVIARLQRAEAKKDEAQAAHATAEATKREKTTDVRQKILEKSGESYSGWMIGCDVHA